MCMWVQVPVGSSRERWSPWSQSHRQLLAILLGCWELNLGSLQEQFVLLIAEQSL